MNASPSRIDFVDFKLPGKHGPAACQNALERAAAVFDIVERRFKFKKLYVGAIGFMSIVLKTTLHVNSRR